MAFDGYRIFISAVTTEFGSARDAVAASLRSRGLLVKVQSDFRQEGDADTTLRKLHNYIKTCDAVICIVGRRSGACPPAAAAEPFISMLPSGFSEASYTQWEFFFARHNKKNRFIYLADANYSPDRPALTEPVDRADLQDAFIKFISEQGFDYNRFSEMHELRADVLLQDWPARGTTGPPILHLQQYVAALGQQLAEDSAGYTPLSVQSETDMPPPEVIQAPMLFGYNRAPVAPEGRSKLEEINAKPIADVFRDHSTVVIRGDPGSGKSASCRYLIHQACLRWNSANRVAPEQAPVPVLIELHRFRLEQNEDAWDALARQFAYALRQNGAFDPTIEPLAEYGRFWFERATTAQPFVLFLDGLNEVAPGFRDACYDAINQLVTKLRGSQSKVLVTTRRHGFEAYRLGSLRIFDLQPLSETQITRYMAKRLGWPDSRVAEIFSALSERLRFQTSNPLHLNLLCEVLRQGEAPPASRAQLFKLFIDGVLERWEGAKHYDFGQRTFSLPAKHDALRTLAVSMQTSGRSLSQDETERTIARTQFGQTSPEKVSPLLEELCTNHLLRRRQGTIEFIHHAVQEYFCAMAVLADWQSYRMQRRTSVAAYGTGLFQTALEDQSWWEPLSVIGGLLEPVELTDLLSEVSLRPVLASMIIANSAPGTTTELNFVKSLKTRLIRQISDTMVLSQIVLWSTVILATVLLVIFMVNGPRSSASTLLLRASLQNPWNGISPAAAFWGFLTFGVLLSTICYRLVLAGIIRIHDEFLRYRIQQAIEPSLLALRYLETESARGATAECMETVRSSRWTDHVLIERVRAYADRSLPDDLWELSELLDHAGMRGVVLSILIHEYDFKLASHLIERLAERTSLRRAAEIALYKAWLTRYGRAREELMPLLQAQISADEWPYPLKRKIYRSAREAGLKMRRPSGLISHWIGVVAGLGPLMTGVVANILLFPLVVVARIGLRVSGPQSVFAIWLLNAVKKSIFVIPWARTQALTLGVYRGYERAELPVAAFEVLQWGLARHPDNVDLRFLLR